MLTLPSRPAPVVRPPHQWQTVSAAEAAGMIRTGNTVAVSWLGDAVASAIQAAFLAQRQPRDLTLVYGATKGNARTHGLNMLAEEGLVRRVIGGQWHPVPALHAMALSDRIEAYSLPVGIINRLFRDIAAGVSGHLSRSGIGTFTDPRNGGGRLNRSTPDEMVRLVHSAGEEALLFKTFPIDVALVAVAFVEGTGEIAMTRDAAVIARAARKSNGVVIAQTDRVGTLDKLPQGQIVAPDALIDVLVAAGNQDRAPERFAAGPAGLSPV
jgi:propionate CoA-transferase